MVFQAHARVETYEVSDKFYSCNMEENSSVSGHILKMSGLHNRLSQLGVNLLDDLGETSRKIFVFCNVPQHMEHMRCSKS